jgi:nucleotide-binding universal stress UspA family protein
MRSVKLVGVENSRFQLLRKNLQSAIERLPHAVNFQQITDVERILTYKLSSIPAIILDDDVIFESGYLPDSQEIEALLSKNLINPIQNNRILVPTDFSEAARDAYLFAQYLAEYKHSTSINVVNVCQPIPDGMPLHAGQELDLMNKSALMRTEDFAQTHQLLSHNGTSYTTHVALGFPSEKLVSLSNETAVDMIIMGTTGDSSLLKKWLGSVSTHVAEKAFCPVLLVPVGTRYRRFDKVLIASDLTFKDDIVVSLVYDWLTDSNPELHLVHIKTDSDIAYEVETAQWLKTSKQAQRLYKAVILRSTSVAEGLNHYIEKNDIDLLIMATTHRSPIQQLMHKKVTKEMAIASEIPTLVLHYGI